MKNLLLAAVLTVIAIGLTSRAKGPDAQAPLDPAAVAQTTAAIAELPLSRSTKEAYLARIGETPRADLPYLVEEARRAVISQ